MNVTDQSYRSKAENDDESLLNAKELAQVLMISYDYLVYSTHRGKFQPTVQAAGRGTKSLYSKSAVLGIAIDLAVASISRPELTAEKAGLYFNRELLDSRTRSKVEKPVLFSRGGVGKDFSFTWKSRMEARIHLVSQVEGIGGEPSYGVKFVDIAFLLDAVERRFDRLVEIKNMQL